MVVAFQLLEGVLLAGLLIAFARRRRKENRVFGIGLVVAATYYVVEVILAAAWRELPLELFGLALFGVLGILGFRGRRWLLAAGWAGHVAWDVVYHTGGRGAYVPEWYPMLCVGFDIFLAGFIVGMIVSNQTAKMRSY